jgi:hypothetical protein
VNHLLKLLAVSCEENDAGSGSVSNADNIARDNLRTIWGSAEWLVVVTRAIGMIGDGVLVETYIHC